MVRPRGLEPLFRKEAEPKSAAYTIFATGVYLVFCAGGERKTFTEVTSPKSNVSANSTTPAYSQIFVIVLLRCPISSSPFKRLRQPSTAATRSGCFIRHRRRSHRSPPRPHWGYSIIYLEVCQRKTYPP